VIFKAGDIVTLKCGGPEMVVASVGDYGVYCRWFEGRRLHNKPFPPETLRKRRRTSPPKPPDITLKFVNPDGTVASTQKLTK
jgi:uncharacterized protein YodC (DUF2158 family)